MTGLKIVIVNGAPGSGKTSFESFCQDKMGDYCQIRSTVDLVKEIALFYTGWNGEKDLKSRKFLSDLKDLLSQYVLKMSGKMSWICTASKSALIFSLLTVESQKKLCDLSVSLVRLLC